MNIIAYELTAAAALLFGQIDEGIPVAIIRGAAYAASDRENIFNTLVVDQHQLRRIIESVIRATENMKDFNDRILSWAVRLLAKASFSSKNSS
jgi:F420-0:gamma-glutamyl ligase